MKALTHFQEQALTLIAEGDTNQEAADKLFVSPAALRRSLAQVFRKLGAKNRTHAVYLYFSSRMICPFTREESLLPSLGSKAKVIKIENRC